MHESRDYDQSIWEIRDKTEPPALACVTERMGRWAMKGFTIRGESVGGIAPNQEAGT